MESTLLLLDCIAIILVVLWYVRNDTRKPGEKVGGLLRYLQLSGTEEKRKPKPKRGPRPWNETGNWNETGR